MTQEERWNNKYQEVMAFVVCNHRKPSKYYPEERLLFHFIHHNKKLLNARALKAERLERFEGLLALCDQYRRKNQYE